MTRTLHLAYKIERLIAHQKYSGHVRGQTEISNKTRWRIRSWSRTQLVSISKKLKAKLRLWQSSSVWMVLSIPGKGSGCTPTWLYIWASISNLRSATLATISSIFAKSNSVSPFKFFWERRDLIFTFFVYENSGINMHMVILSNMAAQNKDGGRKRPGCLAARARWPVLWPYTNFIFPFEYLSNY